MVDVLGGIFTVWLFLAIGLIAIYAEFHYIRREFLYMIKDSLDNPKQTMLLGRGQKLSAYVELGSCHSQMQTKFVLFY